MNINNLWVSFWENPLAIIFTGAAIVFILVILGIEIYRYVRYRKRGMRKNRYHALVAAHIAGQGQGEAQEMVLSERGAAVIAKEYAKENHPNSSAPSIVEMFTAGFLMRQKRSRKQGKLSHGDRESAAKQAVEKAFPPLSKVGLVYKLADRTVEAIARQYWQYR